ncbi:MAG TPA: hypothetical protein VHS33_05980 [Sphingomicrobium sp.]|jgi:hypothetical protein|nr:hypothetical protein [Sphingomicrobium sp.]
MIRSVSFLFLGICICTGPAGASTYTATLAAPASARFIARDITWNCGAAACQGSTDESRPVVLCESLARRAGRIDSFIVDGRSFTPAELEQCNASAKPSRGEPLASK